MILVQTQFKGNIPFQTLSGVQGSGAFITVSWAAERVSSTLSLSPGWLEQSWVSLASPGPEKPEITHRHLEPPGGCLGMPGDIWEHSGTTWNSLEYPGPSWTILAPEQPGEYCAQSTYWAKFHRHAHFSHFSQKCHFCHFWAKCHFLAFMAILTPGPTLATKNVTGYMGAWSLS